ncbi:MAG: hypothetical protein IT378_23540, partial [Sandaracinaceae bacterium]|nr:hypothetical protein [Sandaracinaceae bacterium]
MRLLALALMLLPISIVRAETYTVGPSGGVRQLADLPALQAGDVVELERGATYTPGRFFDSGAAGSPIVIRAAAGAGARPIVEGGSNAIELGADHLVLEGLEIRDGSARCVFVHGHDLVLRDLVIHGCPNHGIEGGGSGGGDLTLDHVEIYDSGEGTQHHQVYVSSDEVMHPGSRFRMQYCYIHDGNGGNNVKSRHERNEIYFNWIEGAFYHELELIGPDPDDAGVAEDEAIENSDVAGNVLVKGGGHGDFWVVRFGGDGTGQTFGRYRFVNSTVILAGTSAGVFRLFDGIDTLEAHNNVFFRNGAGSGRMVRDVETEWLSTRLIAGANNWVSSGIGDVPSEWTGTITGGDPGFEDLAGHDLRPATGSELIDMGTGTTSGPAGHPFPSPLALPTHHPPARTRLALGEEMPRPAVGTIDLGAYEFGSGPPIRNDGGALPMDAGTCVPDCTGRVCGDDGCGGSCGDCGARETCNAGACECAATDCGGACVDTSSDPDHCGSCNNVCEVDQVCQGGGCTSECTGGLTACNRACVDTRTDE